MVTMIKEVYEISVDMWKNDRKEFWEVYGGLGIVVFTFLLCWYVVIPIFG
jgi:hypothetical protein